MSSDSSGNIIYGGEGIDTNYNTIHMYPVVGYYDVVTNSEPWNYSLYGGTDPITMSAVNKLDGSLLFGSVSTTELTLY
jgi:hypothetical protein